MDAITACFANSFAAAGGLCAGPLPIVDHQRLSGQGYCYSASMPALLAATGLESLDKLEHHPEWIEKLRANVATFRSAFKDGPHFALEGDAISPVIHVRLREHLPNREAEELLLQDAVQLVRSVGGLGTGAGLGLGFGRGFGGALAGLWRGFGGAWVGPGLGGAGAREGQG